MNEFKVQLGRKRELLNQILDITERQAAVIEAEDTDALLTCISKRQNLIDELDAIQADLPSREALLGDGECVAMIGEINGILENIQANDARNEQAALNRMEELRSQLRKVNEGRKTYGGYETTGVNRIGGLYINKTK
ncbi:MAG: flagellar protein FliT [Oscillospiraceae bacterium]|nr:flagellar protein FliT [Oscillospiraceae bacterium]